MYFLYNYIYIYMYVCIYIGSLLMAATSYIEIMRITLTRLRTDSRGTPTARGRQCRISKKGQEESETRE